MGTKRKLSENEKQMLVCLQKHVTFLPASFDKRFVNSISSETECTEKQLKYIEFLFNKYRRQIPDYATLALQFFPERFNIDVQFNSNLFQTDVDIKIKDTFTPKKSPYQ
jgi:hypothetical protein